MEILRQVAPEAVMVLEVTPVIHPVVRPVILASSSKGMDRSVTLFELPVPAVMLIFT